MVVESAGGYRSTVTDERGFAPWPHPMPAIVSAPGRALTLAFDAVVVLEGGRVAELGTPAELRAREGGSFARLLAAQELTH